MKHEAQFQTLFKRWLDALWEGGSAAFELKRSKTDSLPFDAVEVHQKENLLRANRGAFYYKIPDDSIGQKPFDCFVLRDVDAYIVIAFGPRIKEFFLIPIDTWLQLEKESARKSIHVDTLRGVSAVRTITL